MLITSTEVIPEIQNLKKQNIIGQLTAYLSRKMRKREEGRRQDLLLIFLFILISIID